MADRTPIPLNAVNIKFTSPDYNLISSWPFTDPFVSRMLQSDIPRRTETNSCQIYIYYDPDQTIVGFGTLEVSQDYLQYSGGQPHPYIPLLAVNPTIKSLGYGTTIVRHLIAESKDLAFQTTPCSNILFLDVYLTSTKAIAVYLDCGFSQITPDPLTDPEESGKEYIVMAKQV